MTETVHFEVQAQEQDGWYTRFRYAGNERAMAILMAEDLDAGKDVGNVRIARVTTFEDGRPPMETVEWTSPTEGVPRPPAAAASAGRTPPPPTSSPPPAAFTPAGPSLRTAFDAADETARRRAIVKATVVAVLATLAALAAAPLAWFAVKRLAASGAALFPGLEIITVVAVGILTFTLFAFGAARFLMTEEDRERLFDKDDDPRPSATPPKEPAVNMLSDGPSPLPKAILPDPPDIEERPPVPPPPAELPPTAPAPALPIPPPRPEPADEAPAEPPTEPADLGFDLAPPEPTAVPRPITGEDRRRMLHFLEQALVELSIDMEGMDARALFGVTLLLGGAGEQFGTRLGLKPMQKFVLIREAISALGLSPDTVDTFCEHFIDYDRGEDTREMVVAGRAIMERHLDGDPTAFEDLAEVFESWRNPDDTVADTRPEPEPEAGSSPTPAVMEETAPAPAAETQENLIVMVTDLVRPVSDETETDEDREGLLRSHNRTVRGAVADFHGEEIEHTGNGIVAAFPAAANAVRAAIRIHRALSGKAHGNRIRIGIEAGGHDGSEPGAHGPTAKAAARLCDAAGADQSLISETVRDLCRNHAFMIDAAGAVEPDDGSEKKAVYAVIWRAD